MPVELSQRDADDGKNPYDDCIACPTCDTLFQKINVDFDHKATCPVCHSVLMAPQRSAGMHIIMLSLTVMVLIVSALFFPFLTVSAAGLSNEASLLDVVLSFNEPHLVPLAIAVCAMIIILPLLRMMLNIYVLAPLVMDARPYPYAAFAFRWAEELRHWTMAEIFVLGVAVSLVKVAGMARIELGEAFWMFAVLVVIALWNDRYMCRNSVWQALEQNSR